MEPGLRVTGHWVRDFSNVQIAYNFAARMVNDLRQISVKWYKIELPAPLQPSAGIHGAL